MNNFVNRLVFIVLFFTFAQNGICQCYVRMEDASGLNTDPYQGALQAAAAKLCEIFDSTGFAGQFKVYDFGFYLHQENTTGGYPEAFAQKIEEVQSLSPYYLLFGKQTDPTGVYTRFWVDMVLPDTGIFYCIDRLSLSLRGDLTAKYGIIANAVHDANEKTYLRYHEAEIKTIDSLHTYVTALKECCIPPGQQRRGEQSCTSCAFTQSQFAVQLDDAGMASSSFTKIIVTNPSPGQGEEIGYMVESLGGSMDLDTVMTSVKAAILSEFPDLSIKIYPFNYGDNCSNYQNLKEQFLNENVDLGILIGVVGENGKAGSVHWQTISRNFYAVSPPQAASDTIYYFDKNGKYFRKEAGEGGPRGIWLDKCGEGCNYEFSFADPILTPRTLTFTDTIEDGELVYYPGTDEPMITKVIAMNKDVIFSLLNAGTAFDRNPNDILSLKNGSSGYNAPFDFSTKEYFFARENYLFITDDGENIVAHNYRNMGNFLWGATTAIMGIYEWVALAGAHYNNLTTDGGWDSDDDQWSIQVGRMYAKKLNWKAIYGGRASIFRN